MFAADRVAEKAAAATSEVLELMAADPSGVVHLKFGNEMVPMQSLVARQWSKVLATAIKTESRKLGCGIVIPMKCSKEDWLTVAKFIYPTTPHPAVTWDNLEVLLRIADKYDMRAILDICADFLVQHKGELEADVSSCMFAWKWIGLADKAGLTEAAQACFDTQSTAVAFNNNCSKQLVEGLSPALLQHISVMYASRFCVPGSHYCSRCKTVTVWRSAHGSSSSINVWCGNCSVGTGWEA